MYKNQNVKDVTDGQAADACGSPFQGKVLTWEDIGHFDD